MKVIRTSTIALSLDYLLKGQLSFLNMHYQIIAVSGKDLHLEIVADREKVRTNNIHMKRSISLLKDLVALWKLFMLFKREKPLIVHSITPKAGLLSMVAGKMAGVPIRIHTFTGLIFPTRTGLIKKILILMDKVLCKCATNVYPEGIGVKKDLMNYKITSKPLKVLANGNVNGIDTTFFSQQQVTSEENVILRNELIIADADFVFIFVGRLVGDKGINELVEAFSKLKLSNVKLLLVGNEEMEFDPLLNSTIEEIKKNKNIIAAGFQSDVRKYYAISDALVFPSYREGFPNVVLQAGAMGLPSIVTDISGSNEIILDGHNGTVIPIKDQNALLKEMIKMVLDGEYYNSLKKNSRELITSRYEQKLVWDAILAEYKRLEKNV